jgi:tRNA wybutosine-synthesizing protein 5
VLRLASHDTQLWTHFDVMDNALAQIVGRKRVVFWPPEADAELYVDGSSSRINNIDAWNDECFPSFRRGVGLRREAWLNPGEVVFIPALWFHNVTSVGFSVALNVFWRSHHGFNQPHARSHSDVYGRDLYGNRDPPTATFALEQVSAAVTALQRLPDPFKSFYARRASRLLLERPAQLDANPHQSKPTNLRRNSTHVSC